MHSVKFSHCFLQFLLGNVGDAHASPYPCNERQALFPMPVLHGILEAPPEHAHHLGLLIRAGKLKEGGREGRREEGREERRGENKCRRKPSHPSLRHTLPYNPNPNPDFCPYLDHTLRYNPNPIKYIYIYHQSPLASYTAHTYLGRRGEGGRDGHHGRKPDRAHGRKYSVAFGEGAEATTTGEKDGEEPVDVNGFAVHNLEPGYHFHDLAKGVSEVHTPEKNCTRELREMNINDVSNKNNTE